MAGTTTYYGISYPTSTDYVKDGATAMQTIADGFDSAVAIPTYNNQTGTTYTFVLADAGKTVTSNNASAVTFTIPPQASVAWANNTTLTVRNLGAGVVTIAGGAGVTVTNTAQTVAQYGEVKLIRTASNAWTVVPASGSPSGLTLITTQSFSAATSINVNNCFSSTYKFYKVIVTVNSATGTPSIARLRMRASGADNTTTNYYRGGFNVGLLTASAFASTNSANESSYFVGGLAGAYGALCDIDFLSPFETQYTKIASRLSGDSANVSQGFFLTTASFDGFSLNLDSGNCTGSVRIYGYQD